MKLEDIRQKYSQPLKGKANVTGTAIGYAYRGGKLDTSEVCLLVFVDKKVSISALAAKDVIPPEIEGAKTDVQIRVAEIVQDPRKSKMRPTKCGISIGHVAVTTTGILSSSSMMTLLGRCR